MRSSQQRVGHEGSSGSFRAVCDSVWGLLSGICSWNGGSAGPRQPRCARALPALRTRCSEPVAMSSVLLILAGRFILGRSRGSSPAEGSVVLERWGRRPLLVVTLPRGPGTSKRSRCRFWRDYALQFAF